MENNEIMEKLMQDDIHSEIKNNTSPSNKSSKDGTALSNIRIVTAKYKVLIVILLIIICVFAFILIPRITDTYNNTKSVYDAETAKLNEINREIVVAKNDMNFLTGIIYNEENLKKCLNNNDECSSLPEDWQKETANWDKEYDYTIPLSYLQLHSLYNKKMPVDEKRVLKNLNEYLIKENMEWTWKTWKVWNILRIEIWDPKNVVFWNGKFFEVPVDVEIEFETIGDLTGFLYNVEKKLINNWEDRILYKIQSVSYDIVSHDEPQVTDISMQAYYYYDENFFEKDDSGVMKEINEFNYYFKGESTDNSELDDEGIVNDEWYESSEEDIPNFEDVNLEEIFSEDIEESSSSSKDSFINKIFNF